MVYSPKIGWMCYMWRDSRGMVELDGHLPDFRIVWPLLSQVTQKYTVSTARTELASMQSLWYAKEDKFDRTKSTNQRFTAGKSASFKVMANPSSCPIEKKNRLYEANTVQWSWKTIISVTVPTVTDHVSLFPGALYIDYVNLKHHWEWLGSKRVNVWKGLE